MKNSNHFEDQYLNLQRELSEAASEEIQKKLEEEFGIRLIFLHECIMFGEENVKFVRMGEVYKRFLEEGHRVLKNRVRLIRANFKGHKERVWAVIEGYVCHWYTRKPIFIIEKIPAYMVETANGCTTLQQALRRKTLKEALIQYHSLDSVEELAIFDKEEDRPLTASELGQMGGAKSKTSLQQKRDAANARWQKAKKGKGK